MKNNTAAERIAAIEAAVASAQNCWDGLTWTHLIGAGDDNQIEVDASVYGLTNLDDTAELAAAVEKLIGKHDVDDTPDLREAIEDAIRDAVAYRQQVEADAAEASDYADQALAQVRAGDWDDAIESIEQAAALEDGYGDTPAYGDLADLIRQAQLEDLRDVSAAADIHALCAMLSDAWYDAVEGVYRGVVPTWGDETESVRLQIGNSCADGDIVSWDTRDLNHANHLYLRRAWRPAHQFDQPEHVFSVVPAAEYDPQPVYEVDEAMCGDLFDADVRDVAQYLTDHGCPAVVVFDAHQCDPQYEPPEALWLAALQYAEDASARRLEEQA